MLRNPAHRIAGITKKNMMMLFLEQYYGSIRTFLYNSNISTHLYAYAVHFDILTFVCDPQDYN